MGVARLSPGVTENSCHPSSGLASLFNFPVKVKKVEKRFDVERKGRRKRRKKRLNWWTPL